MNMKKTLLTLAFSAVLSVLSFAQTVQKTYCFGTPAVGVVNGYDVIRFADTYNDGAPGEASLPWQMVSLLLPQNTEAQSITVEYSDFVELEGTYNILPQQKARPLSSKEPLVFEKNEAYYHSEDVFPETAFSEVHTQYLSGCSFAFARFSPVRYVPATGKVSYAKSATVTIELAVSKSDCSKKLWMTPEVQGRAERLAQNLEAVQEYKNRARLISGYEILVITPQEWVPYFDEYIAFYETRGLRTHVTALEDILDDFDGRDDAEKMRNYIIQEYENEGIMMVLLGGDSNILPWRALYCFAQEGYADNIPADMYFGCLDGTWDDDNNGVWGEVGEEDFAPELAVGRMPFRNGTQLNNMIHKTIGYQDNPVLGEFHDVVFGAEHLGDGYYGSTDLERLIGGSDDYDYSTVGIPTDFDFMKIYEGTPSGWSGDIFKTAINNNGGHYVHHVGHADTDYVAGWYATQIDDNFFAKLDGVQHNYSFFHTHGCVCGDFSHNCILEKMVTISTGFVAVTGNSRYGWYVPWGDGMAAHLHREFVDAYYNDRLPYIGTAFVEMKTATAPYAFYDGCMRWNLYCLNILGDVAACPWLDQPFRPEVNYASALTLGTTGMPITITKNGVAQDHFRCSIFHNGVLIAFGETNAEGYTNVEFEEPLAVADTMQLIITGPNAWPQTIDIVGIDGNTPYIYPQTIDIHGDFVFGTDISMDVDFKNAAMVDANNVTATLTTTSDYVTMTKSTVDVGTVLAGESAMIADAFEVVVADDIPDGTYVDFFMSCTDGNHVWNRDVFFQAAAPNLIINDLSYEEVDGNHNGFLDPGETFVINVSGKNAGHHVAQNPYIHGSVNVGYVSFVNNDVHFDEVGIGSEFMESIELRIADDAPEGTILTVNVSAVSGEYSTPKTLRMTIGTVKEDFETGDFSRMEWQHKGDTYWFVSDTMPHTGHYSAQCGHLIKNQRTSLIIEMENITDGDLTFYYKTNTTYHQDCFGIKIDGILKALFSGDIDWTLATYELKAGHHIIEWLYDTANNGGNGGNVCWIDDVTFPGNTLILNVEAVVEDKKVEVYPNPANDVVNLKGEGIQYVEIYNSIGMRVLSMNVNSSESIDIAGFASGMYIMRIFDSKGVISTEKIIKK